MPLYEYECTSCGRRTETLQRFGDPPLEVCPHCGGAMRKMFSAPAFQFKGSGWYVTDYARKSGGGGSEGGAAKDSGKDPGKDAGKDSGTAAATDAGKDKGASGASTGGDTTASDSAAAKPAKKDTPAG